MEKIKLNSIRVMFACSALMMVCALYAQDELTPSTAYKMAVCGFIGLVATVVIYVEYKMS